MGGEGSGLLLGLNCIATLSVDVAKDLWIKIENQLIHLSSITVSSEREKLSYICGLRARIKCEPVSEHLTRSDRVTNIG